MTDASLIKRVELAAHSDNALDVEIEIALFEPGRHWTKIRTNDAGTKVIYTHRSGAEKTFWADEWTTSGRKSDTLDLLRARALKGEGE